MIEREQWFYEDAAGRHAGPISPSALEELRTRGAITPTTRVWQKGQPDWQAMHTIDPSLPEKQPCAECGSPHPPSDLLQYGSTPICTACKDTVVSKLQLGGHIGQGFWDEGEFLVAESNKILPQRCFKCNAEATAAYRKKLSWAPWWPSLLFLPGIIISSTMASLHPFFAGIIGYVIADRILRKKSSITVHLCYAHAKKRLIAFITFGASVVLAPVALLSGSLIYSQMGNEVLAGALLSIGGAAIISLIISNRITNRFVTLKFVESDLLFLKGAGREFLDSLPRWHGLRSDR